MATFVETADFSRWRRRFLTDDAYSDLQKELVANPEKGKVMPGCGGLRKLRVADPKRQKGKRGGARAIYLHIAEADRFVMLDIYGKDEKDDLTPREKKELRELAREYKTVVVEMVREAKEEREL